MTQQAGTRDTAIRHRFASTCRKHAHLWLTEHGCDLIDRLTDVAKRRTHNANSSRVDDIFSARSVQDICKTTGIVTSGT